jgi:hypothetical protein
MPSNMPAAAIELMWWKRPAPRASARRTVLRVPSTLTASLLLGAGAQVVERGQVEEVVDLALELLLLGLGDAEMRIFQVAHHRDGAAFVTAPEGVQRGELFRVVRAGEKIEGAIRAGEQLSDEPLADEAVAPVTK